MSSEGSPPLERRPEGPKLQVGPRTFVDGMPSPKHRRFMALAFSVAAHLMAFAALFWFRAASLPQHDTSSHSPILVSLVSLPTPPGTPGAKEVGAVGPQNIVRPPVPHPTVQASVLAAASSPVPVLTVVSTGMGDTSDLLSESQLSGATSAGEGEAGGSGGGGGGSCNTAQAVQQALRRDPLVRSAVEDAHRLGKAILLWNGDWVRSGQQEGKGLSAVREAIIWEVAFAPQACRNERVHGLVLLSLEDGSTRFAIGSNDWRWSDLLGMGVESSDR
jgi:hypothetical protein